MSRPAFRVRKDQRLLNMHTYTQNIPNNLSSYDTVSSETRGLIGATWKESSSGTYDEKKLPKLIDMPRISFMNFELMVCYIGGGFRLTYYGNRCPSLKISSSCAPELTCRQDIL